MWIFFIVVGIYNIGAISLNPRGNVYFLKFFVIVCFYFNCVQSYLWSMKGKTLSLLNCPSINKPVFM